MGEANFKTGSFGAHLDGMTERARYLSRQGRAVSEVLEERRRQDEKWSDQWAPGVTGEEVKLAILMEEVGEVAREVLEGGTNLRGELVQCCAVALAFLESLPEAKPGEARRQS